MLDIKSIKHYFFFDLHCFILIIEYINRKVEEVKEREEGIYNEYCCVDHIGKSYSIPMYNIIAKKTQLNEPNTNQLEVISWHTTRKMAENGKRKVEQDQYEDIDIVEVQQRIKSWKKE